MAGYPDRITMFDLPSLQRFRRLGGDRRRLLLRAAIALAGSSAAVKLLPFRRAIAYGSVPVSPERSGAVAADQVWAVEAVARRLPSRTMCIEKGLAVQRLARAAGIDARLHYGARHEPGSGKLQAHVWVTVGGRAIIGGEEAAAFNEVATYP
jgi:Transglutaminase-like superfamily